MVRRKSIGGRVCWCFRRKSMLILSEEEYAGALGGRVCWCVRRKSMLVFRRKSMLSLSEEEYADSF